MVCIYVKLNICNLNLLVQHLYSLRLNLNELKMIEILEMLALN